VLEIGQHACHPIMCLDLNGANTLNLTRSIMSHTYKISSMHKLIQTEQVFITEKTKQQYRVSIHHHEKHMQQKQLDHHLQNYH
jgi:hypothetical protein